MQFTNAWWMDGEIDRWMEEPTGGTDGQMNGDIDRWINGWPDG